METEIQVATYTATLTRELCRLCRKAGLNDVAYFLEIAAAQASHVATPVTNGAARQRLSKEGRGVVGQPLSVG